MGAKQRARPRLRSRCRRALLPPPVARPHRHDPAEPPPALRARRARTAQSSLVFPPDRGDHLGGSGGSDRVRAARSGRAVGRSPVWPGAGAEHEGRPRDLDLDDFHDEDAAHGQWIDRNGGYVLTTKTRGGGFSLPMADCYRLGPYPNPRTRATRKARRWAASASSLRNWVRRQTGKDAWECLACIGRTS